MTEGGLAASLLLSWREGVSAEPEGEDGLRVQGPGCRMTLRRLSPGAAAALRGLASPGTEEDRLARLVLDGEGPSALAAWYYCLQGLARRGLISRCVRDGDGCLATLLPTSPSFVLGPLTLPECPCSLSRFAYLRREGDALLLESPLAHARVVLADGRAAALVGALAKAGTVAELAERAAGLPAEAVAPLLSLLGSAGMLHEEAEERPALRSWEFHDLLFHARSRRGRSDAPYGATYRMAGELPPPPALKPAGAGEVHELSRPDLEQLRRQEPPFTDILERRRSLREYGPRPITVRQLGEFLYRVARVRDCKEVEVPTPQGPVPMAFAFRPYPAGGGLHELEFYIAVNACEGLASGLYHYEPQRHTLRRVCERTAEVGQLLSDAAASAAMPADRLQIVVVLAARFQRLAWKYASIAYALVLKHVGVVYQTMYLAATAMDLAPCALGGGDADLFARAAGTDYCAETSVGEFLLGSRPPDGEG